MDITEKELVSGIKKKSEASLNCLVDQYGGLIKSIVSYHLKDPLREECINDVLFSIWCNIEKFNPNKNTLKNWIGAICKYKCIDYKRKYYRERCVSLEETMIAPDSADGIVLKQELEEEINQLLSSLPPRDRELFRRRYLNEETVEEIAAEMKVTAAVLYNRLSRGRKKLKQNYLRSGRYEK